MAGEAQIEGQTINFYVQVGSAWIMIGCCNSIDIDDGTEVLEIMCDANGNVPEYLYGKENLKISLGGIYKKYSSGEAATNYGLDELRAAKRAKTRIMVQWGKAAAGEKVNRIECLITSAKDSHKNSQVSTWTAELQGSGPLTSATIAN